MAAPSGTEDLEATLLLPRDDRRWAAASGRQVAFAARARALAVVGLNPLVTEATPLLCAALALRDASCPADPLHLRASLLRAVAEVERRAREAGVSGEHVHAASYVLCSLLDEAVAGTRWGAGCGWLRQSLLVSLHGEAFGGELVFRLMEQALGHPGRHIDLLELLALLLSLGFQGRFGLQPGGALRLAALREHLHGAIRRERGAGEAALSDPLPEPPAAPSDNAAARGRARRMLLFGSASCASLALAGLFADALLAPQRDALRALLTAATVAPRRLPVAAGPVPGDLRSLLADEIAAGRLLLIESAAGQALLLQADALYASGAADIDPALRPLLQRLAAALDRVPGTIRVTGHTDDQRPRSGTPFSSNDALSLARARGVAAQLALGLSDPARLQAQGRGAAEPRAGNGDAEGRRRNRRVEILLSAGPRGPDGNLR